MPERVLTHLHFLCDLVHLDFTSFHVDGEYPSDDDAQHHLTKGYSRDHRPEFNRVFLNLITENQAGIPVCMQVCSGNTNDSFIDTEPGYSGSWYEGDKYRDLYS